MDGPLIQQQLPALLASYIPFLLIPLAMSIDFVGRLTNTARMVDAQKIKTL